MNRLQATLQTINLIRKEKTPPLLRYCVLLTLAGSSEPLSVGQINAALGEETSGGGTFDTMVRMGLIQAGKNRLGFRCFTITPAGKEQVERILRGERAGVAR